VLDETNTDAFSWRAIGEAGNHHFAVGQCGDPFDLLCDIGAAACTDLGDNAVEETARFRRGTAGRKIGPAICGMRAAQRCHGPTIGHIDLAALGGASGGPLPEIEVAVDQAVPAWSRALQSAFQRIQRAIHFGEVVVDLGKRRALRFTRIPFG
jgi:hypothetical protein